MKRVPPRIAVSFLLAVGGVLLMIGLVLERALGRVAVIGYVILLMVPLVAGLVGGARRRSRLAAGRTCTCCTGTVHDPVQVV